jgi:hypothetical protein
MAPLLHPGDQVSLTAVSLADLYPGDIITLVTQTGFVTHRYWGDQTKNGRLYLHTKGDRVWQPDPPHLAENLLGKVEMRVRRERPLSFTTGKGAWLNRHLAWLGTAEYRLVTGKKLEIRDWRLAPVRLTVFGRFIRWACWLWATGIVYVIGIIPPNETNHYPDSKTTG